MTLREQFEKETGLLTDYCTGSGDISGLEKDYDNLSSYCKWLEAKFTPHNTDYAKLPTPHQLYEKVSNRVTFEDCEVILKEIKLGNFA